MNTPSRPFLGPANQTSSHLQARAAKPRPKISLARGVLLTQRLLGHESLKIAVHTGHVWITNEGDPEDYVLAAGETFEIAGPATLLVEGILHGAEFEMDVHHTGGMILAS